MPELGSLPVALWAIGALSSGLLAEAWCPSVFCGMQRHWACMYWLRGTGAGGLVCASVVWCAVSGFAVGVFGVFRESRTHTKRSPQYRFGHLLTWHGMAWCMLRGVSCVLLCCLLLQALAWCAERVWSSMQLLLPVMIIRVCCGTLLWRYSQSLTFLVTAVVCELKHPTCAHGVSIVCVCITSVPIVWVHASVACTCSRPAAVVAVVVDERPSIGSNSCTAALVSLWHGASDVAELGSFGVVR